MHGDLKLFFVVLRFFFLFIVKKCCIKRCKSESYAGCGISFHSYSFPSKEEIKQKWLNVIPESQTITKNSVVCSLHFKPADFRIAKSRRALNSNAVPSIFTVPKNKQILVLSNKLLPSRLVVEPTPSTSQAGLSEPMKIDLSTPSLSDQPPAKKFCMCFKNVAVQTEIQRYSSPAEDDLKRKVKILTLRLNRRESKLKNFESILSILKKRKQNYDEIDHMMKNNFVNIHDHLNTDKSNKGIRYSEDVKQFALSLYYYSSKAYLLLRNHIALPHPATLRKILATHDCKVGFMAEVFDFLKLSVAKNDLQDVALIFDAMSIKSEEVYDKNKDKKWGYVDFAGIVPYDSERLATEVLVFQIVSYKRKFKCPIAYFLIDKISAAVQAQLIITAIRMLSEIQITVRSLTCDGTAVNLSTYEYLGCNFAVPNMVTNFKHPNKNTKVHCIFDPAHMLKLCRNVFAETNLSSRTGNIDFDFVKELYLLQDKEGLRLANKLNASHINFFGKKMNVKLAAQTLSSSVADAIDFLKVTGNDKFQNSQATTEYIRIVDRAFDVLNAKSPLGVGFKSPLRLSNKDIWMSILKETREYLEALSVDNQNILSHRRKMAALGLIVDTYSTENLALDLLQPVGNNLNYFLPYKFSQDQLEMFFSCVRAQGGGNNNPNALQFMYTMRKLLYRNSVKPSINANCTDDDFELSPILEFRSPERAFLQTHGSESNEEQKLDALINYMDKVNLSDYKMNILYYLTGHCAYKLLNKISCEDCRNILITPKQHSDHLYFIDVTNFSSFTAFIDRGGLKYASRFAFEVIKCGEKLFISDLSYVSFRNTSKHKIVMRLKQMFYTKLKQLINPPHPIQCITEEEPHELQIVKALANAYLNLRMFHHAKCNALRNLGSKIGLRQKLHKTILFSHV